MRISIDAQTRLGLRIIEEIPSIPLCKLQGYNGIGKTNAIKLLRLCTGDQPFDGNEPSWRTFRSQLVRAHVRVSGLEGGQTIEWTLDPTSWPKEPEPVGESLGAVSINGMPARPRDVKSILRVYHINAAETPLAVLRERVNRSRKYVQDWKEIDGESKREALDLRLGALQEQIMRSVPSRVHQDLEASRDAEEAVKGIRLKLTLSVERAGLLDQAVETADWLDQVRDRGPEMEQKIDILQDRLNSIQSAKTLLDDQISTASGRQHEDEEAKKEFENAQKSLVRQDKILRTARDEIERLAAIVDAEPTRDGVAQERTRLGSLLNELVRSLPQVNATPMLVSVLSDLIERLTDAEAHDLGTVILLEASNSRPAWTLGDLRAECQKQIAIFSARTPSADATRLAAEIAIVRSRIDALAQADESFNALEQAEQNVSRAQLRLRSAAEALPPQTAQTLEDLIKDRNELDEESRTIQAEHARLTHARELLGGGRTEDALAAELVRLCRAANVEPARVRGRRERVRTEVDELTRREATALQHAERTQKTVTERTQRLAEVVAYFTGDSSLGWLRRAVPNLASIASESVTEQAKALDALVDTLESGRARLRAGYASVENIGIAFTKLHDRLSDLGHSETRLTQWDNLAQLWLAAEVRRWFDNDFISEAMFDGARNIELNAVDMRVTWSSNGSPRERPLSAFSSGQQALAYTRAQLIMLDREEAPAENRLIALDEFGAFLDANRMRDLRGYLYEHHSDASPQDQVVVILPLEALPSAELEEEDVEGAARVSDLEQRGYIVEELGRD